MSSKYIVRLDNSISEDEYKDAIAKFESQGGHVSHHHTLFKGFSGSLPNEKISVLESLPHVEAIEPDQEVSVAAAAST